MITVHSSDITTPLDLAKSIVRILQDKKARNIKLLFVEEQTVLTSYFVICEGRSSTQIRALADELDDVIGKAGLAPLHKDGLQSGSWTVLDFGSVIVHLFDRQTREFYNLEKLWGDATAVDISDNLDDSEKADTSEE